MAEVRSRTFHRSVLSPRSRTRIEAGLVLAIALPLLVTPLSIGALETLPALPYYLAIAAAARVGRLLAGAVALAVSIALLLTFAFAGEGRPDPLWIPLASFIGLSALIAAAISFERASSARIALTGARLHMLADATRILDAGLDSHAALQRLAERVVPELADWCAIHVMRDDVAIPVAVAHPDPAKVALARSLQEEYPADPRDPGGLYEVIRTGVPVHIAEISDEMLQAAARDPRHLEVLRSVGVRSAIVAPMTARGRTFGALTVIAAEGALRYDDDDVVFVSELAARAASIVDAVAAYEMEHAALIRERVLQRFSDALTPATTVAQVLDVIVRDAIEMVGADRTLIAIADANAANLAIAAQSGYPSEVTDRWRTFPLAGQLPLSEAVRERRTVVIADRATRDARYPSLADEPMEERTVVCLPLLAEGEVFGGISISYPNVRDLGPADLATLESIAGQAAQALRRATLFEERDRTARLLQEALLPRELPRVHGMRLAAGYWPTGGTDQVGGDFYDVLETPRGLLAVVGDVCGRGPEAASVTGIVRATIRTLAHRDVTLVEIFEAVNEALLAEERRTPLTFVTVCAVRLAPTEPGTGVPHRAEILCAGHPHPVIVGPGGPRAAGTSNLALGIEDGIAMATVVETLSPGEGMVLYTDGLAERDRRHVPLETDPVLLPALERACLDGPETFVASVERTMRDAPNASVPGDDVAVLVLCLEDPSPGSDDARERTPLAAGSER